MIFKSAPLGELIDVDESAGIVKGYGSIFGNVDSDGDIINKGAYTKTISENGSRVRYLYQHDMSKPLGKINSLYEDDKGLVFEAELPKTTLGMDVIALMKGGVITENSVGIIPINKSMNGQYREINEVKLFEISAVTMAANSQAAILDVKGNFDAEKVLKRYDALAKLIRKGQISDELGYAIEGEIMKLKGLLVNFTKPSKDTLPNEADVLVDVLKYFNQNLKIS